MVSTRWLRIGNVLAFLGTIVVNSLANILPLNGITTGELSDYYANLFTPAGYVFSIWGVIYLLLGVFTFYQYKADDSIHEQIDILFIVSCIFNSVWIFLWHYQFVSLSLIAMFGILGCLILIYVRLGIGVTDVSNEVRNMVHLPFSVYLGWITVAPIANVAAFLVDRGWDGFNQAAINMTVGMILIAMALTLINTYTRGDLAYASVIVWALGGIYQKQVNTVMIPQVAAAAMVIIVLGVLAKKFVKQG